MHMHGYNTNTQEVYYRFDHVWYCWNPTLDKCKSQGFTRKYTFARTSTCELIDNC